MISGEGVVFLVIVDDNLVFVQLMACQAMLAKTGVVVPEDMAEDDGVMLENIIRVPGNTKAKVGWRE
jgi:hypothetical protein